METQKTISNTETVFSNTKLFLQAVLHNFIPAERILSSLEFRYSDDKITGNVINGLTEKKLAFNVENIRNEYRNQLASIKSSEEEKEVKLSFFMRQYEGFEFDKAKLKQALAACSIESEVIEKVRNNQQTTTVFTENDEDISELVPEVIDLASISPKSPISAMAQAAAKATQMPKNTCFWAVLAIFSSLCSRYANVSYIDGETIPSSLYLCSEQPSNASKGRVLNAAKKPIIALAEADETELQQKINSLKDDFYGSNDKKEQSSIKREIARLKRDKLSLFVAFTDVTLEALDARLQASQGFFCIASSEQASVNTMLGLNYSREGSQNIDLLLSGYVGDKHNALRVGRETYNGNIIGSVCVLAQEGTIKNILSVSKNSGLAQRFVLWVDPNNIGKRDHLEYHPICAGVREIYDNAVKKVYELTDFQKKYNELTTLSLSANAWRKIYELKQDYEPTLCDGEENSADLIRGIIGKIDMLIMKVASVLHLSIDTENTLIHDDRVDEAIQIAQAYIIHVKALIHDSGVYGLSEQDNAILELLGKKNLSGKQIADKLYRKVCFHSQGKMSRKFVVAAIEKLVERDLVTVAKSAELFNDRIFTKS